MPEKLLIYRDRAGAPGWTIRIGCRARALQPE